MCGHYVSVILIEISVMHWRETFTLVILLTFFYIAKVEFSWSIQSKNKKIKVTKTMFHELPFPYISPFP